MRIALVTSLIALAAFGFVFAPSGSGSAARLGVRSALAQVNAVEFRLYQPGSSDVVGWVYASPDGTREYWAYIDGTYQWGTSANTAGNRWKLEAQYLGDGNYTSFAAFKTAVLARTEAQGESITFQNHEVDEETVQN